VPVPLYDYRYPVNDNEKGIQSENRLIRHFHLLRILDTHKLNIERTLKDQDEEISMG
jgi:hypothetical protein